jgi:hypothetical protein
MLSRSDFILLLPALLPSAALRASMPHVTGRRSALCGGALAALAHAAPGTAYDLPPLGEGFDNPRLRARFASKPNPMPSKQQGDAFYAVSTNANGELQKMLDGGWKLAELEDTAKKTVLHRAAQVGNTGAVEVLLKAGAPVDPLTAWKETPLHLATRNGKIDAVKQLVSAGASTSAVTVGKDTALELSRKYKKRDVEEYLAALKR